MKFYSKEEGGSLSCLNQVVHRIIV